MDVRLASWASLASFWEVLWICNPILEARRANSDCFPGVRTSACWLVLLPSPALASSATHPRAPSIPSHAAYRSGDLPTCSPGPFAAVPPRSRTRSCDHAPGASQAPSLQIELAFPLVWDASSPADTPHVQIHPRRRSTKARTRRLHTRWKREGSEGERDVDAEGSGVRGRFA